MASLSRLTKEWRGGGSEVVGGRDTSGHMTPCWCKQYTACESLSPKIACSIWTPVTSSWPLEAPRATRVITARCTTSGMSSSLQTWIMLPRRADRWG